MPFRFLLDKFYFFKDSVQYGLQYGDFKKAVGADLKKPNAYILI